MCDKQIKKFRYHMLMLENIFYKTWRQRSLLKMSLFVLSCINWVILTDYKSFVNLEIWLKLIEKYAMKNIPIVLIANKHDLTIR